jgi:hypothetical protein
LSSTSRDYDSCAAFRIKRVPCDITEEGELLRKSHPQRRVVAYLNDGDAHPAGHEAVVGLPGSPGDLRAIELIEQLVPELNKGLLPVGALFEPHP